MGIGLDASLSIAASGLLAVQGQIAVVSQNVTNAGTAGYAEEVAPTVAALAGDEPSGVRLGVTTRITAPALQGALWSQNASVAYNTTMNTALTAVAAASGATDSDDGSTGSLTASLSTLQSAFTALGTDPSSGSAQQTVMADAASLASGVQGLATTYATERQNASDGIASTIAGINGDLASIGTLSDQIVTLRAQGFSTADLENQRDAVITTLSSALSVKCQEQPNGGMLVMTTSGITLPTNATSGPLSYGRTELGAASAYVAGSDASTIPGIMLDGNDVTGSLTGGTLGAEITLRDTTLPTDAAELDSFAATVAQRFSAQGLTLFSDASGAVPTTSAAATGFSAVMQVNPSVTAEPSLVRDGTDDIAGSSDGASAFTVNPADGPAGFTTLITRVLTYTFGSEAAAEVAQPSVQTTSLGADGNLSLPYSGAGTLADFAANLAAAQGEDASGVADALSTATATQTALQSGIASVSGVSVDTEMAKMTTLENSYSANAKVIAAVQSMFTDLLEAVGTAA